MYKQQPFYGANTRSVACRVMEMLSKADHRVQSRATALCAAVRGWTGEWRIFRWV